MRQFDVFVWGNDSTSTSKGEAAPPFTDKALAWFFVDTPNERLAESEAEWIVFAHSSVQIDRQFLNDLAECTSSYPMVDAFAPRIHDSAAGKFISGFKLDKRSGLSMLEENAPLRFVAAPHPKLAAFSGRIVQRTGRFDDTLSIEAQFADFAFRMLHAGGKMFSVPYLVANATGIGTENAYAQAPRDLAYALVKAFGIPHSARFLIKNPKAISHIWKNRKELFEKRDKATLLSKFKKTSLAELL